MFEIAKIFIRSLVAIVTIGIMICYGMYLGQVSVEVQVAALMVIGSCVLFDKSKMPDST